MPSKWWTDGAGIVKASLVWVIRAEDAMYWRNMVGLRTTLVLLHAYMDSGVLENEQQGEHVVVRIERGYELKIAIILGIRPENTDNKGRLSVILDGFRQVYDEFHLPLIFPAHLRTVKMIHEFNLQIPEGVRITDPVGYLEFLQLESGAQLILPDSGGLQEEAYILGVPCVTLRDNTERPETVDVGANVVAGTNIIECTRQMMQAGNGWQNPYGNGDASKVMINELTTLN